MGPDCELGWKDYGCRERQVLRSPCHIPSRSHSDPTSTSTPPRWPDEIHWDCAMLQDNLERRRNGGLVRGTYPPYAPSGSQCRHYVRNVCSHSSLAFPFGLTLFDDSQIRSHAAVFWHAILTIALLWADGVSTRIPDAVWLTAAW